MGLLVEVSFSQPMNSEDTFRSSSVGVVGQVPSQSLRERTVESWVSELKAGFSWSVYRFCTTVPVTGSVS